MVMVASAIYDLARMRRRNRILDAIYIDSVSTDPTCANCVSSLAASYNHPLSTDTFCLLCNNGL